MSTVVRVHLAVVLFIFLYFLYFGLISTPQALHEVDSLTYHIPIAQKIAQRDFVNLQEIPEGLGYYPAIGESILALFIFLKLPLGWYNILAYGCLFLILIGIGTRLGLKKESVISLACSVLMLPTIIRLIPYQTVDMWLVIFYLGIIYLILKPSNSWQLWIGLGVGFGALIGVKYSGMLYAAILLLFFGRRLWSYGNWEKKLVFLILSLFFGGGWFIRNYLVTGNPFFPVQVGPWIGDQTYMSALWPAIKTLKRLDGVFLVIQAFISEYLIWSLLPIALLISIKFKRARNVFRSSPNLLFLLLIGFINFLIFLPQPLGMNIQITVSNMRFLYPAMISLMIVWFYLIDKTNYRKVFYSLALLSSISYLPQISYYPKLIMLWIVIVVVAIQKNNLRLFVSKQVRKPAH